MVSYLGDSMMHTFCAKSSLKSCGSGTSTAGVVDSSAVMTTRLMAFRATPAQQTPVSGSAIAMRPAAMLAFTS